ncbi:hypothetical protein P7C73_g2573, partial [Tremellales sp. Uapishka_1]
MPPISFDDPAVEPIVSLLRSLGPSLAIDPQQLSAKSARLGHMLNATDYGRITDQLDRARYDQLCNDYPLGSILSREDFDKLSAASRLIPIRSFSAQIAGKLAEILSNADTAIRWTELETREEKSHHLTVLQAQLLAQLYTDGVLKGIESGSTYIDDNVVRQHVLASILGGDAHSCSHDTSITRLRSDSDKTLDTVIGPTGVTRHYTTWNGMYDEGRLDGR